MHCKLLPLSLFILLFSFAAYAQHEQCGMSHIYDNLFQNNPELETQYQNYLDAVPLLSQIQNNNRSVSPPIITIPVVVHVLHDGETVGTGQNISDAQVEAQIEVMNEDFIAQNSNYNSTPAQWQSVIGNPEIQFCLASIDPNGNPTNGIERYNLAVSGSSINNSNIESSIKPQTAWNTNLYYNIWVLDIPGTSQFGGVLGYAYLPQGGIVGNDIDGVVCDYRWFGGPGFNISGYKTMTHETGHYLGLPHTFGNGTGCGDDDGIADTPDISDATSSLNSSLNCGNNFPTGPISCGNEHMYVNYMDYVNDSRCYTSFSQGQINVMRAVLEGNAGSFGLQNRTQLVANAVTACVTTANDAGISKIESPNGTICANPVTPIVTIQNYGSNTLTSALITCTINGGSPITFNWTGSLAQGASQDITLNPFTAPAGSFTFECSTSNPNTATDEDTSNDSAATSNIFTSLNTPYSEGFEGTAFPPNSMSVVNDGGDEWEWTRSASVGAYGTSSASAFFDNFNDDDGSIANTRDRLDLPPLDLSGNSNTELTFDWAHTNYVGNNSSYSDSLLVWVSIDCGLTWTTVFNIGDGTFESAPAQSGAFTPSASQWVSETIDLSAFDGQSNVIISFVNGSGWGNNTYLDNINIESGSSCAFTVATTSNGVSCNAACDGSASATATSANVTYLWDNGATTSTVNNLCAGTYSVTVSDGLCDRTSTVTVAEPAAISVTDNITNISCFGACDGSVVANAAGGTFPFSYQWSNGATTASVNGLCAGTYTVTITDANNCTSASSITINQPAGPGVLPYQEGFEATNFPPNGITVDNVDGDTWEWVRTTDAGGFGASTASALLDNWDSNDANVIGTRDRLVLPSLDFTSSSDTELTFDWAHTNYSGADGFYGDSLLVRVSTDCEISWTTVLNIGDGTYESAPAQEDLFTPTSTQWITETIDMSQFDGESNVVVEFTNVSGWGNRAYLDNINLEAGSSCAFTVAASSNNVSCNSACDGTALVTATGGTNVTYLWDNGETTASINNLCAGTYTVTVSDGLCDRISSVTITEPNAIAPADNTTDVSCFGVCDGSATVSAIGGTAPFSYLWDNGTTTSTLSAVCAGTYSVTITDTNNCTSVYSVAVSQPAGPQVLPYQEGFESTLFPPTGVTLNNPDGDEWLWDRTTNASGYGASSASAWFDNFNDDDGSIRGTKDWMILPPLDLSNSSNTELTFDWAHTSYDGSSTVDTDSLIIWVTTDCGINSTEIFRIGGTDYESAPADAASFVPTANEWQSETLSLSAYDGEANVQVAFINHSDWGNNAYLDNINIDASIVCAVNATASATNVLCNGDANGSISLTVAGATAPVSYQWDNGMTMQNPTGLAAGTYCVTVNDANNCPANTCVTINEPTALNSNTTSVGTSCNGNDGEATVTVTGGTPPYSYQWSDGQTNATATGLVIGTYSVLITDANNCTFQDVAAVADACNCAVNATASATNVLCNGDANGSISLTVAGATAPVSYQWDNGMTMQNPTGLAAGTYCVTVNDANNCPANTCVTITEPTALNIATAGTDASCAGNDGTASATVAGGTAPYSYQWDDAATQTTATATGLAPGAYIVIITDVNNCSLQEIAIVQDACSCAVNAVASASNSNCGAPDGTATVNVTGAGTNVSYAWSNGANTQTVTNLPPGTYTVTVTDLASGCDDISTVTVGDGGSISVNTITTPVSCNGLNDGTATVSTSGNFTYAWSNGATTSTITNVPAGTYLVTVTQGTCVDVETAIVNEPAELSATIFGNDNFCSENAGSASAGATGGTAPYSYQWSNGVTTGGINGLSSGSYSLTVTDSNGCVSFSSVNIVSIDDSPGPVAQATGVSCTGDSDGSVDLTVNGGQAPYSYSWTGGATTEDLSGLPPGPYTVVVTDANGCVGVASVLVTEPSPVNVNTSSTASTGNDGTATATAFGGTAPYTYNWSDGQTTATAINLAPGTYTVVVTDANGCMTTLSVLVDNEVGINDLSNLTNLNVYPNPTIGQFIVELSFADFEDAEVSLVNVIGQTLHTELRSGTDFNIPFDLSMQADGVYFIVVTTEKGRATERVVLLK